MPGRYEEGGHFRPHKDTEKESGMFGTLVVQLPTAIGHEGGTLVVRHQGRKKEFAWQDPNGTYGTTGVHPGDDGDDVVGATAAGSRLPRVAVRCATFYADCEHELRPVTGGVRLCLLYNLVRSTPGPPPVAAAGQAGSATQLRLSAAAESWARNSATLDKIIVPLEHEYTMASLSFGGLKGRDRAMADALCSCPEMDVYLTMLVKHESGSAAYDPYDRYSMRGMRPTRDGYCVRMSEGGYSDDEDDDEEDDEAEGQTMDEIFDTEVDAEHRWVGLGSDAPLALGRLGIDPETEVLDCTARYPGRAESDDDDSDDGYEEYDEEGGMELLFPEGVEPDRREYEGYTGNCSPTLDFWYHKAVLVIWPSAKSLRIALSCGIGVALEVARQRSSRFGAASALPLTDLAQLISMAEAPASAPVNSSHAQHSRQSGAAPSAEGRALVNNAHHTATLLGLCVDAGTAGLTHCRRLLRLLAEPGSNRKGTAFGIASHQVGNGIAALALKLGWEVVGEDVMRLVEACYLDQAMHVARLAQQLSSVAAVVKVRPKLSPLLPPLTVPHDRDDGHEHEQGHRVGMAAVQVKMELPPQQQSENSMEDATGDCDEGKDRGQPNGQLTVTVCVKAELRDEPPQEQEGENNARDAIGDPGHDQLVAVGVKAELQLHPAPPPQQQQQQQQQENSLREMGGDQDDGQGQGKGHSRLVPTVPVKAELQQQQPKENKNAGDANGERETGQMQGQGHHHPGVAVAVNAELQDQPPQQQLLEKNNAGGANGEPETGQGPGQGHHHPGAGVAIKKKLKDQPPTPPMLPASPQQQYQQQSNDYAAEGSRNRLKENVQGLDDVKEEVPIKSGVCESRKLQEETNSSNSSSQLVTRDATSTSNPSPPPANPRTKFSGSAGALLASIFAEGISTRLSSAENVTRVGIVGIVRLCLSLHCASQLRRFVEKDSADLATPLLAIAVHTCRQWLCEHLGSSTTNPAQPTAEHSFAVVTMTTRLMGRDFALLGGSDVVTAAEDVLWLTGRTEGGEGLEQSFVGAMLSITDEEMRQGRLKSVLERKAVQSAVRAGNVFWKALGEKRLRYLELMRPPPKMSWEQPRATVPGVCVCVCW